MSSKANKFKRSELLSTQENESVKNLVGINKTVLATGIVQLFLTEAPHTEWRKEATGIICFVKDFNLKAYFFRLYDMQQLIWELQIYDNFNYIENLPFFHSFEGINGIVGFNFASAQEAKYFKQQVFQYDKVIPEKGNSNTMWNNLMPSKNKSKKSKTKVKKISKLEIGDPCNFMHVAHKGSDTFDYSNNPKIAEILKEAGISPIVMRDTETRRMVNSYLEEKKADEVLKRRTKRRAPPPPPSTGSNQSQTSSLSSLGSRAPPTPPSIHSIPSIRNPAIRRTPTDHFINTPRPPPLPQKENPSSIPLPPPPPLPVNILTSNAPSATENAAKPNAIVDERSALLESIRNGQKLKPVEQREIQKTNIDDTDRSILAQALFTALSKREKVFLSSSDSDSEAISEDDWSA